MAACDRERPNWAGAGGTATRRPQQGARAKVQVNFRLFHLNGRLFKPSHRLTSGGRLPTFSGLPHGPLSLTKFPLSSRGSSPEASEDEARGLPPGQRPSAAAVPAPGDLAPCGGWRGRDPGRALRCGGGAAASSLHYHWSRAPDWRAYVTARAHPLGNVFRLLHS